jgi:(p)ppGpp synthase/HD superfamily hydrolase
MTQYAQTNLQLFRQLGDLGMNEADLAMIGRGYTLAMRLFAGSYRPSGKAMVNHLVGTASILAGAGASIEIVAAGLLHAVYSEADFGPLRGGLAAKRQLVRSSIGDAAEALIDRYSKLQWGDASLDRLRNTFDSLDNPTRAVLLIRLANELEDYLDLGVIYCTDCDRRQRFISRTGPVMLELAERLGQMPLATAMRTAFAECTDATPAAGLANLTCKESSFVLAPLSWRKPLTVDLRERCHGLVKRMRAVRRRIVAQAKV